MMKQGKVNKELSLCFNSKNAKKRESVMCEKRGLKSSFFRPEMDDYLVSFFIQFGQTHVDLIWVLVPNTD